MPNRGLLFGLNTYAGSPLAGCVNDIIDTGNFSATKRDFYRYNIRLLTDARCKAKDMRDRLLAFAKALKSGEKGLVQFSGHGTQVAARNKEHELDGLDEVLCPIDFDFTPGRMIIDDELFDIFKRIPKGVKLTFISDSCHSGDLTREIKQYKTRNFPIPADVAWRNAAAIEKGCKVERSLTDGKLDIAFISGCRSDQTSADAHFGNRPNGALTYFLLKTASAADPKTPVKDLMVAVNKALSGNGFSQQSQPDGTLIDQPFL